MTDFLNSLKADLTDRRLLPAVAFVLVALGAAVAYAVLSGGSGSGSHVAAVVAPSPSGGGGLAVIQTQASPSQAVAETTNGLSVQRRGSAHDPFALLPSAVKEAAAATAKSSASAAGATATAGTSAGSKSGSSSQGASSESTPAPSSPSKPSTPAKPKTIYQVAVQFGPLPAGVLPQDAELHSYLALSKATPLPSAKNKLIEFLGVTVSGSSKAAAFSLSGEVILHGAAACLPSATQCKMIDLKEGKSEQLEYLSETGQVSTYELRVVSIASTKATSASVKSVLSAQSHAARSLLGSGGLLKLAGLHFSSQAGVLAFDHHPSAASARTAQHHPRRRG